MGLRTDWLEFANRCNATGLLAKFTLGPRDDGGNLFRASAVFHAAYGRTAFGAFIGAWHTDMALMQHAPTWRAP